MATIVLQAAGAWLGGVFGTVGAAVGSAAGALAGYMVDRAILTGNQHYEGPRLTSANMMVAEEGSPLPRVYGTVRVGGALIWATRFEERSTTTRQGAKGGGPSQTTYSYYANLAFALCEGEIAGVRRIWADGRELDLREVNLRIYRGDEDQQPDPLIRSKQGMGNAPAYRGIAYVVFEQFPIDDYGRRIPQFQFEVLRPAGELRSRIKSVALIPGATEYGLSPTLVTSSGEPGETTAENRHNLHDATDFEASIDELMTLCPNLEQVALVVTWFGTDLRAGDCKIKPMVVHAGGEYSQAWTVSGIARGAADAVSLHEGRAAYGGTPSDKSVIDAIKALKARGLKVALYPFIMMDVPHGNALPDPYGGASQAAYPWRGRITCHPAPGEAGSVDQTSTAAAQVSAFVGSAGAGQFVTASSTINFTGSSTEWSFRRHILHYAHLAELAGGVDGFIVGTEMPGLTRVRGMGNAFPFVQALTDLAADARDILGDDTWITYAADWSEYFGYHPQDGSGDVFFHLDSFWSSDAVDCIGIDYYMPLSDWRDEDVGVGRADGFASAYDLEGLKNGIAAGEGYDWYYASASDRYERTRSPIEDTAYEKHWVFRYKDLNAWWSNQHFDRIGGVEVEAPTAWVPKSKRFHFTELGCAAVDKGPNQPNLFPDSKSVENGVPYFSNGGRADLAQHRFLLAHHQYWQESDETRNPVSPIYDRRMVDPDQLSIWAWDLRPFPDFPVETDVWGDGKNWSNGHWLNGRLSGIAVADLINAILTDHGLPQADTTRADGTVEGYVINNPTTARASLEPIVNLFGIAVHAGPDGLVFATEGRDQTTARTIRDLVIPDEGDVVVRTRTPDLSLPANAQLDFRDQLNEHQSATASVKRIGAEGAGTAFVSFPGVLAVGEASALVNDYLRRTWDRRDEIAFSLPITEQDIRVGSVVRLEVEAREYFVTEIEEGLVRRIRAIHIVRAPDTPASENTLPELADRTFAFGPPHALLMDLPLATGTDQPQDCLRIATRAKPWRSQAVYSSPEASGFALRTVLTERATVGKLLSPLAGASVEGRPDRGTTLLVQLFDGELQSVSIPQLLNGANAGAVLAANGVWEVLQFQRAEEVAVNQWELRTFLRGQLGTSDAMAAGADAGAPFVLLDDRVLPAGLRPEEIGLELNWKVGPTGHDLTDEHFVSLSVVGGIRAQLPLSPVHLRHNMVDGALHLSWTRRCRGVEADSWLNENVPLGEASERYLVEIFEVGGPEPLRSVTTEEPSWTYGEALISADFGTLPDAIDVRVRQISAAVGPGIPAHRTFSLN